MNKLTIVITLLLALIVGTTHCLSIGHKRGLYLQSTTDGDKALNNAISIAIGNAIQSGDFKTIQLSSNDLSAAPGSCTRSMLFGADFSDPTAFTGTLRAVYDSKQLRVGVSTVHDDPAFFAIVDGQASGYLPDVIKIVSSYLGLVLGTNIDPVFVPYNVSSFFQDSVDLLERGEADTVIDVTFLVGRLNRADYTCVYERAIPFAVYRDENAPLPDGFNLPETLEGWNNPQIKVATVGGTVYSAAAEKFLPLAQKVFFPSASEAFQSVGTSTDITFYDTASIASYNSVSNNRLTQQTGTVILFAGGTGFITKKNE